jgi:hypothetical protein
MAVETPTIPAPMMTTRLLFFEGIFSKPKAPVEIATRSRLTLVPYLQKLMS